MNCRPSSALSDSPGSALIEKPQLRKRQLQGVECLWRASIRALASDYASYTPCRESPFQLSSRCRERPHQLWCPVHPCRERELWCPVHPCRERPFQLSSPCRERPFQLSSPCREGPRVLDRSQGRKNLCRRKRRSGSPIQRQVTARSSCFPWLIPRVGERFPCRRGGVRSVTWFK